MRHLLLIYIDEGERARVTPEEMTAGLAEYAALNERLDAKQARVFAAALQPPSTATTVRTRNGESVITDGPFAETAEHLAGFFIVDAADEGEAIAYAQMLPNTVEVRPEMDMCSLEAQGDAP